MEETVALAVERVFAFTDPPTTDADEREVRALILFRLAVPPPAVYVIGARAGNEAHAEILEVKEEVDATGIPLRRRVGVEFRIAQSIRIASKLISLTLMLPL
jgi:hypothetical protein